MKNQTELFAQKLKNRRTELKMTQKELADRLGYSEKTVSKWESGRVIAPSIILTSLAAVLRTDVGFLLSGECQNYYLGVDGGGTKTEFVLTDEGGNTVSSVILECSNPVDIGFKASCELLARGIGEVCADIPTSSVSAFFGIAGGTTGDNRERLHEFLKRFGFSCFANGSDAQNAVSTALGDENGSIVIMGTGTIAFSQINGSLVRRGGYGYLFERGGSGFAIGRDAVMAALLHEERGASSILRDELCRELGAARLSDSVQALYLGGKRKIASLTPAVFRAYESGDRDADAILRTNMKCIAELIESTPVTDQKAEKQRIVIMGGLVSSCDVLIPMIQDALSTPSSYSVSCNTSHPVSGALRLARKLKGGTPC